LLREEVSLRYQHDVADEQEQRRIEYLHPDPLHEQEIRARHQPCNQQDQRQDRADAGPEPRNRDRQEKAEESHDAHLHRQRPGGPRDVVSVEDIVDDVRDDERRRHGRSDGRDLHRTQSRCAVGDQDDLILEHLSRDLVVHDVHKGIGGKIAVVADEHPVIFIRRDADPREPDTLADDDVPEVQAEVLQSQLKRKGGVDAVAVVDQQHFTADGAVPIGPEVDVAQRRRDRRKFRNRREELSRRRQRKRILEAHRIPPEGFRQAGVVHHDGASQDEVKGKHDALGVGDGRRQHLVVVQALLRLFQCGVDVRGLLVLGKRRVGFHLLDDVADLQEALVEIALGVKDIDADDLGVIAAQRVDHVGDVCPGPGPAPQGIDAFVVDRHDDDRRRRGLLAQAQTQVVELVFQRLDRSPLEEAGGQGENHQDQSDHQIRYDRFLGLGHEVLLSKCEAAAARLPQMSY